LNESFLHIVNLTIPLTCESTSRDSVTPLTIDIGLRAVDCHFTDHAASLSMVLQRGTLYWQPVQGHVRS